MIGDERKGRETHARRHCGTQAGVEALPFDARVAAGVGWGFETARLHWRLRVGLPLGLSAAARLGYGDWRGRLAGRLFYGRVGQTAELLDRRVSYGWLQASGEF